MNMEEPPALDPHTPWYRHEDWLAVLVGGMILTRRFPILLVDCGRNLFEKLVWQTEFVGIESA